MIETVEQRLARLKSEAKTREARAAEYRAKMNFPAVPVLAEPKEGKPQPHCSRGSEADVIIQTSHKLRSREPNGTDSESIARESKQPVTGTLTRSNADSRGGRKPFDRKAYQREYMRLYRAAKKLEKKHDG